MINLFLENFAIFRVFRVYFSPVVKMYYVNQLSARRVVRAMRCCHEMRVRVDIAIVFWCARVYSSIFRLSRISNNDIDFNMISIISVRKENATLTTRFLVYLIYSRVIWHVTDLSAAILDESTLSPTDTRTFRNNNKIKISTFRVFTSHNKFYCIN